GRLKSSSPALQACRPFVGEARKVCLVSHIFRNFRGQDGNRFRRKGNVEGSAAGSGNLSRLIITGVLQGDREPCHWQIRLNGNYLRRTRKVDRNNGRVLRI